MECVSPILKSSGQWEAVIENVWEALRDMFEVQKSLSCGTHIHVAPWKRNYTLGEAKTIAFACCYYERYIVSCLPTARRDNPYCMRNSKVSSRMGHFYQLKTTDGLAWIAYDINTRNDFGQLISYMQGASNDRRVLWNFCNLCDSSKGTIEFRGGRHMRGWHRAVAWVAFVQVFVLMALEEVRTRGISGIVRVVNRILEHFTNFEHARRP